VKLRRQGADFPLWTRGRADAGVRQENASPHVHRLALLALVLIPWLGLGTFLLTMFHARERDALRDAALTHASLAATVLDRQISDLIRTVGWLQDASQASDRVADPATDLHGVRFQAWDSALNVIAPAGTPPDELGTTARIAAEAALATKMPRVTPSLDDAEVRGVDLWLPLVKKGGDPILLQARIPVSFLDGAIKTLEFDDRWTLAVLGSNGTALASLNGIAEQNDVLKKAAVGSEDVFPPAGAYLVAASETSPLGFQVGAAAPLASLDAENRRNWLTFLFVTALLTAATLAAERWISDMRVAKRGIHGSEVLMSSDDTTNGRRHLQRASLTRVGPTKGQLLQPSKQGVADESLRDALDAGGICAWEWRRADHAIVWKTSCADLLRRPPDSPPPTLRALVRRTFPNERRRLLHAIRIAFADGRPLVIDVRVTCFDGEQRWIAIRGKPVRGDAGRIEGFVGIAHDVTDQKRGLSRTDALLREVSHRSKNMLALILAMARLTARDAVDVKSHLKEFALRVAGLAASQDLIVAADWQSVDFATLAAAEIEAVARSDSSRVEISGPPLLVTPEAAQTLGMILTELALNASEHGALSVASGQVHLSWTFPNAAAIRISWRETGGPKYDASRPKGYGMSVVERFSTQGLKLESRVVTDGDGVTWNLEGPLAHVGIGSPPPSG
jgi:two-component sensor histidine kinase